MLRTAIAAGRVPRHTAKRSILATGAGAAPDRRRYVVLADHTGLTNYGRAYYEATGHEPPDRKLDLTQEPTRQGNTEFARDRRGQLVQLRTLRPDGSFAYTKAGRHFYSRRQVEYLVHVPVVVEGHRRNGANYTHSTFLPTHLLGLGRIFAEAGLTQAQREASVRSQVLGQLQVRTEGGRTVLLEISGETYYYDGSRPWHIDELVTEPGEHGPVVNYRERVLDAPRANNRRVVMAGPVANAAFVPHADQVLDVAWEEHPDKLCVVRQLAVLLGRGQQEICEHFDRLLEGPWRDEGISTDELFYFCKDQGLPYYCLLGGRMHQAWTPEVPRGRAVAFCAFGGHCYMYRSARCVSDWAPAEEATERTRLTSEPRRSKPAAWEPFEMPPRPGNFLHPDLYFCRQLLLDSGRNPRVTLRTLAELGALRYRCVEAVDGASGDCVIKEAPEDAEAIEGWLERLGRPVDWNKERLPALANRVFLALLAAERRTPTAAEKEAILLRQFGRCAACSGILEADDTEFDHVAAVKTLVRGQRQAYQALCLGCHAEKTSLDGGWRSIESRFSKGAWDDYVRSPKMPPLSWQPHAPQALASVELDVRRCRRNALMYSAHDFPVFCALDGIVAATEGVLGDFSYVTGVWDERLSALSRLPFVGPGWYHRVAVEHLLHYGKIRWGHISHSFSATGRLPAGCFRGPLEKMEAAWRDPALAKRAVNMMVGVWAIDRSESYSVVSSGSPADGQGCWAKRPVGDGGVVDYIFRTVLLDNASMRPIHDQILHTEACRVAELLFLVQRCGVPQRCITDVKTDALLVQVAAKRRRLVEAVAQTTFADLPLLRGKERKLDCYCPLAGVSDREPVFRFGEETKRLQGVRRTPCMEAPAPGEAAEWRDLGEEEAEAHVLAGGSLLVLGAPGVGKTHWCRELIKRLPGRVDVIAKTHASCRNFGAEAVSADHWVRKTVRVGRCGCDTLVVEEISQINGYLWNDIAKAAFVGVRFLLLGDFCQLDPVQDSWCGSAVPDGALERSRLLRELVGGARMELTQNHRSDEALFSFYTGLGIGRAPRELEEALADARARFPKRPGSPRYTLVLTHAARVTVNRLRNLEEKPETAVLYRATRTRRGENQPQNMWVYPGQELVGAGGRVRKGLFVTVMAATPDELILDDGATLGAKEAVECLRLSHSITYAACQGLTLKGRVRLAETTHPAFSLKHLYVGSSRCTAASLLEVC